MLTPFFPQPAAETEDSAGILSDHGILTHGRRESNAGPAEADDPVAG